jgi:hypothetical protein
MTPRRRPWSALGRRDGVDHIEDDGTVHFTSTCRAAVADVRADLAAPLAISDLNERAALLDDVLAKR